MNTPNKGVARLLARSRHSLAPAPAAQQRRFASSSKRTPKPSIKTSNSSSSSSSAAARANLKITKPYQPTTTKPKPSFSTSSSSRPPPPRKDETLDSIWRTSWLPLSGAAILAGALGFYIFGTAAASFKSCSCAAPGKEDGIPTGRPPALTGDNADAFDKELDLPEWWMGITKLRKRIASRATGHVLELAMGTGRNLEYYNWTPLNELMGDEGATTSSASKGGEPKPAGIVSFTGLDISVDMLDVARRRLVKTVPPMASSAPIVKASNMADHTGGQLSYLHDQLRLINSDAHHALPHPSTRLVSSKSEKYDTVIQTFGLCSVSDPVKVVSNLATVIKPHTGRIILLEHGKGWYGIVNGLLDKNAGKHHEKYGCWWNRDIEGLVEAAVEKTPGLELVKIERPNISQMGTLVWVELKVTQEKKA